MFLEMKRVSFEKIFANVLVGDGDEFLEVLRSNVFYQSMMDFCYSIFNLISRSKSLKNDLAI